MLFRSRKQNIKNNLKKITNLNELTAAFECTGKAALAEQLIELLGVGGRLGFIGEIDQKVKFIPAGEMFCKELSFFGSRAFRPDEFPEILSLASKIKRKTALLITHHFSIDRKSIRLNSSHTDISRMPSSA